MSFTYVMSCTDAKCEFFGAEIEVTIHYYYSPFIKSHDPMQPDDPEELEVQQVVTSVMDGDESKLLDLTLLPIDWEQVLRNQAEDA